MGSERALTLKLLDPSIEPSSMKLIYSPSLSTALMMSPQAVDCTFGALAVVDGSCRAILCGIERARLMAAKPSDNKLRQSILRNNTPTRSKFMNDDLNSVNPINTGQVNSTCSLRL